MTLLCLKETEMGRFVPKEWKLTDKLREFAKGKGLTDSMIDDQEERFRDCEFPQNRTDFDRCWRRWIRNGIDWGKIVPVRDVTYRQPKEYTEKDRAAAQSAFDNDPLIKLVK